jgi:hypothetical protein
LQDHRQKKGERKENVGTFQWEKPWAKEEDFNNWGRLQEGARGEADGNISREKAIFASSRLTGVH